LAHGGLAIDRRPVALGRLLSRVVELERAADLPQERIAYAPPDAAPVVLGDAERLELVLVNLVENARKYSPPDARIEVRLGATDEAATVSVRDEGVGIPPEEQARIFDRFHRASDVDPGVAGMGLGLYIVQEIVRAHGGRIEVDSTPGQGSTFTVTLPRPAAPPEA
jgi:signal transduction histidine kinase